MKLPRSIEQDMQLFRMGMDELPQSYIDFHSTMAKADMECRVDNDFKIIEYCGLVSDGHMDGMKVRQYIIAMRENDSWNIHTVRWHESGAWFKETSAWIRFLEPVHAWLQ